ncbi:aspartate-semialdehyde dehydrogenase [Sistotremastrum niveocremeum HHB9708]|uniref:Aspartate-semialdehyde dehydrogenase n=1 Tax=Sistotremastrum niveocremeum HHB9708 TaxID=1314777 RepID=A0A164SAW2_9AGAM|nr:aspartate-semialdehyde dehydrogenase [Sistotremastrum niveocremeum HHB9708]
MSSISVGVLGATGLVGQSFILLLSSHPFFRLTTLGASPASAGLAYSKAVENKWKQSTCIPSSVQAIKLHECKPEHFSSCQIVFSGLDADVAGDIESAFRATNIAVFSNAKNHRRDPSVPLLVPLVNPHHLSILPHQQSLHTPPLQKGFIVTNANCSTTALVVPLSALQSRFGPIDQVIVTTMQAISGAGYPGVSAIDILDNVVPYISGEEEKMEWETLKILGGISADGKSFDNHSSHPIKVSASCNRVPVHTGHIMTASVKFSKRPPPSIDEVLKAFDEYVPPYLPQSHPSFASSDFSKIIPTAPPKAIHIHTTPNRPQPLLDRHLDKGASVSVGRVRECGVLDVKFVVLGNNVAIGAATSSVINAEIALARGYI